MNTFDVGILGATGAVGQTFVRLLEDHPWFTVTALAASERSAGSTYREATNWLSGKPMPTRVAGMLVQEAAPDLDCDFVFSGLSSSVAGAVERAFAEAGVPVISNARNYRMQEDVPLVVPEVNPDHLALVREQAWGGRAPDEGGGFVVTNPNCSTVGLICALRPLVDAFGVEAVQVTTMQALSGAGYPGVSGLDALGNVVPFIDGEEEKMAAEPRKILGALEAGRIRDAELAVSAQCNRVPVLNGHLSAVSLKLEQAAAPEDVRQALRAFAPPTADLDLPTAPAVFLHVFDEPSAPQPRRHAGLGRGMTVSVGRVRPCAVLDVKFSVLVHNTVRGAAGGAILNAELLARKGLLTPRRAATPAQATAQ